MKSKKLAVFLLTLVLSLWLFPLNVFASATQTPVTPTSTASITVQNAVENDNLAAYKVIDITYDAGANHLSYEWNSDFADFFAGTTEYNTTAYTVEQFAKLQNNSDPVKNLLAQLPKYIVNKGITPEKTEIVAANGTATFANLAMGEYFIRPTSSTSVYQLMLQKIEPTVVDGTYKIDNEKFTAKKSEVTITKTADKTSVTKNEKVNYTITVDIPTYAANTTDKSFYVSDLLADGLTLDTASIAVKIDGVAVDAAAYTLDTTATTGYTFKFSVSTDQYTNNWSANGGKQLVITYTATLNADDTTEVNTPETNTATFDYSFYPYVENSHKQKTASADVTTFAIKIDKYADDSSSTKLAKAKFDLYRTATQAEIDAGTSVEIPHTAVKGIKLESGLVTDNNGSATFEKYQANGTHYTYYLVETQAPSGYNILDHAVEVHFTDADVSTTDGVYTVRISNKTGFRLPITGGTGTVIFTVVGIALMVGAVVLFVISRKKAKAEENE